MSTEINLYIPTGVKATNELFNGFGKRELLQSVVDQIRNMIRFHRSQQIYPYRMLDEWGIK